MSENKKAFEVQIITLGDGQVGKSSIILRYIDNKFSSSYLSTIGFDSKMKRQKLDNGEEIKIKLFDTAGQERFRSIATTYLKKANGILLVYDITRESSFNNIQNWIADIKNESNKEVPTVLIGNKSDLNDKRVITKERGLQLAKEHNLENHFYETSCQNGANVEDAVNDLVMQVYQKYGNQNSSSKKIKIKKADAKKKQDSTCCLKKKSNN